MANDNEDKKREWSRQFATLFGDYYTFAYSIKDAIDKGIEMPDGSPVAASKIIWDAPNSTEFSKGCWTMMVLFALHSIEPFETLFNDFNNLRKESAVYVKSLKEESDPPTEGEGSPPTFH